MRKAKKSDPKWTRESFARARIFRWLLPEKCPILPEINFFKFCYSNDPKSGLYDKVQDSCYILRPRVWKKSESFILMFILILISVTRVFFAVDSVSKKKKFLRPSIFSQKWPFVVKNGQNGRFSRFKNILHPHFHLQCLQTI